MWLRWSRFWLKTAKKDRDEITPEDARHPDLDDDLGRLYQDLMFGKGLACVRGFPVEQHSIEDLERIYWAFCTHLGYLVSNNSFGHRMVRVQEEVLPDGVQPARGTKSRAELAMHNDAADILSLLCVYPAAEGGESQFASGPAAHNRILAERPDLLGVLYQGFPHHRRSEQPDDQPDVTPYDVPVFSQIDGRICINFTYSSILPAMHTIGREFTPEQNEADRVAQEHPRRAAGRVPTGIRRGSSGQQLRDVSLAVRLRQQHRPEEGALLPPGLDGGAAARTAACRIGREYFHMENKDLRLGYDMVEGRDGTIARNDYKNVDPALADMFKAAQAKPKVGGR